MSVLDRWREFRRAQRDALRASNHPHDRSEQSERVRADRLLADILPSRRSADDGMRPARPRPGASPTGDAALTATSARRRADDRPGRRESATRDDGRTSARPGDDGRRYGQAGRPLNRQSPFYMGFVGGIGVLTALLLWHTLGRLTTVLTLVVIAFFLALTLNPLVEFLTRHGLRRGGAVALVFAGVVAVFTLLGLVVVPPVISQGTDLAQKAPDYLDQILQSTLRQGPRPALRRGRQDPGRVQQADHRRQLPQPGLRRRARRRRGRHRRDLPGLHGAGADAVPARVASPGSSRAPTPSCPPRVAPG